MSEPLLETLVVGFVGEAQDLSDRITRALLQVEKDPAGSEALRKTYQSLGRALHNLKGSSATIGLSEIAELAHLMEDKVAPLKASALPMPAALVDALLSALDAMLRWLRARADKKVDLPDLAVARVALVRADAAAEAAPGGASAPAAPAGEAAETAEGPGSGSGSASDEATGWRVDTATVTGLAGDVERLREMSLRLQSRSQELRRVIAALDQPALRKLTAEAREAIADARRALDADNAETAATLENVEERIRAICTLPVQTLIAPLHRTVRDLSRQLGKEARLSAVGVEVALDRRLLEALRAPLVQLVRNALDHGIEKPEVREAKGKHREGALTIRVEQTGNMAFVEVADDGAGIDVARVRSLALSKGLVGPAELEAMTETQVCQLVFRSGFTTREAVTEVSGRGVGLDVVVASLTRVQGSIEASSIAGQGTRFMLSLPVEIGSTSVLLLRVGETLLGVPTVAVKAVTRAEQAKVSRGRASLLFEHEGRALPLDDLGGRLGLRQAMVPTPGQPVLLVSVGGRELMVAVDEVRGEQTSVVRPLPREVRDLGAFLGAVLLSHGEPVPVLRPGWLASAEGMAVSAAAARQVLVVDDSLTARAVHRSVLESSGYVVHAASSAAQALEHLRHSTYEALVCDIDLGTDVDGVALTAALRGRPETAALPIVLVTAHDHESERQRGRAAGADGFLSKKDCAAGLLLSEVARAVAKRKGGAS
ncbi:MAG TPA: response regulator [Myxococcales bacterium]|jgi:chemotaxis protein histidine kinase CheA/ActR/RegA family two-component response regulator